MTDTPEVRLLNDNVMIKLEPESDTTASGLIIKPQDKHEHVFRAGRVVQVGPGGWNDKTDVREPMMCEVGMRVLFVKFVATHTQSARHVQSIIGKDYAVIKDYDALLVLDDKFDFNKINQ
jgi:co-chaperonin GroES (HSP10)